jgi:3-hydroxyacyl-CoA dehydrogenase
LDTLKFILDGWYTANSSPLNGAALAEPSKLLNHLVEHKMLGKKTGQGFYTYAGKEASENPVARQWLDKNAGK